MLTQQISALFNGTSSQFATLLENIQQNIVVSGSNPLQLVTLSVALFAAIYVLLNGEKRKNEDRKQEESRMSTETCSTLQIIWNHVRYVVDPLVQCALSLLYVFTYHIFQYLGMSRLRFFSPISSPPKINNPPVVKEISEQVEKVTILDDLLNDTSSNTNVQTVSLNEWIYGNKSHTRKQPELLKTIDSNNKFLIAYGGDTSRNLNNACNVDLKHVMSYATLNYGVPLSNCHLVSQINRITDTITEFVKDLTTLVNQTNNTNQKLASMKETSHTNVWSVLDKVVQSIDSSKPSFILFHYSGHGAQVKDVDGDEKDGLDEYILSGKTTIITDDELLKGFIQKLPANCTLIMQMDQCFSGTSTDLPFKYDLPTKKWIEQNKNSVACKAFSLSACNDKQYAYQAHYTTDGGKGEEGGPLSMTMVESTIQSNPLYCEIDNMIRLYNACHSSIKSKFSQESYLLGSTSAKN